jgi:hypothetical protein
MKLYHNHLNYNTLGIVSVNVDTEIDALVRRSLISFEQAERRDGRTVSANDKEKVRQFNSAFLTKLQGSIDLKIEELRKELVIYKNEIYNLLSQKYEVLKEIRSTEKDIQKLEAKEFSLFLTISESVIKMSYGFVKKSIKIVCGITKDLITGKLPLSLSALADRLTQDFSNLAMETLAESVNAMLTITFEAVGENGGIVGNALVGLASAVNDIVNVACSGEVKAIMDGVKWASEAAIATPGTAMEQLAVEEGTKYAKMGNKAVKEYNDIANSSNVKSFIGQSGDAIKKAQDIPSELENAVQDTMVNTGEALAKEGLAAVGTAFPAVKAGAAIAMGVANIYASFCESMSDMPILNTVSSAADQSKANKKARNAADQRKMDELQAKVDDGFKQYEQINKDIITGLNKHTATEMQIVQYSFVSSWLIMSCCQISSLAKAYPYMNRDELITMYWATLGDETFIGISNLVNMNLFSLMMRGFMVYIDQEIKYTPLSCPVIDQKLESLLKQKWGLDRRNYCKYMSSVEVKSFIAQYKETSIATDTQTRSSNMNLDYYVSAYRSMIIDRTKFFNQKFFSNNNLFNSYALKGKNASDSALTPILQDYYDTNIDIDLSTSHAKINLVQSKESTNKGLFILLGLASIVGVTTFILKRSKKNKKNKRG